MAIKVALTYDSAPSRNCPPYEAEGGSVKRDLFSDDGGYATDTALVELMIATKMDAIAGSVRAEGWQWVECCREMPDNLRQMHRYYPEAVELSAEDQAKLDALEVEHDELLEQFDDDEQPDAAERQHFADIERQIHELIEKKEAYSEEARQKAGAFVYLDRWYSLRIERGFVKLEPKEDDAATDGEALPVEQAASQEKRNDELPATVIEDLTAQKTAALRCELEGNPHIALVAVVHSLLLQAAYGGYQGSKSVLQLHLTHERLDGHMKNPQSSRTLETFSGICELNGETLPGNPDDLFDWLLNEPQLKLLDLLAFAAAHGVNAVRTKFCQREKALAHGDQLARALGINMETWFETTGESYLNQVNRTAIEQAVTEACGPEAAQAVKAAKKKSEAVIIAERLLKDTGWLPAALRLRDIQAETTDQEPCFESDEDYYLPQAAE